MASNSNHVRLLSPLSPDECAARLRKAIGHDDLYAWLGSHEIIGTVGAGELRARRNFGFANPWQALFVARWRETDEGTLLTCESRMSRAGIVLAVCLTAMLVLILGTVVVARGVDALNGRGYVKVTAYLLTMVVLTFIGIVYVPLIRRESEKEKRSFTEFVGKVVEARQSTPVVPAV